MENKTLDICIITKLANNRYFSLIDSINDKTSRDVKDRITFYVCYTGNDPAELQRTDLALVGYKHHTIQRRYNFAKNSNELARLGSGGAILFLNDDIELIDDCITHCLRILESADNIGTVGCRLLFADKTIQHAGQLCVIKKETSRLVGVSHYLLNKPDMDLPDYLVFGNTGAFLMIRRDVFLGSGGFDERFKTCFEDVKLNTDMLKSGRINICAGSVKAFHYESNTRNQDMDVSDVALIFKYMNSSSRFLARLEDLRRTIIIV